MRRSPPVEAAAVTALYAFLVPALFHKTDAGWAQEAVPAVDGGRIDVIWGAAPGDVWAGGRRFGLRDELYLGQRRWQELTFKLEEQVLRAFDGVGGAFECNPAFAAGRFHPELFFEVLKVLGVVVVKLLGNACVFEMEGFGGHGSGGKAWSVERKACGAGHSRVKAARSWAASSVSAWGTMLVCASTGMKFVSPSQRGTM